MNNDQKRTLNCLKRLSDYLNNRVGGMTKAEKVEIWEIEHYIKTNSMSSDLEWIPISKAVPDEEGEYMTTTIHGSVYCDHWNGEYFERTETVIAWMKLPAPYKWEESK